MLKEFREFVSRGNVLDLAVAVIIGAAFGAIVTSMVEDIFNPIIGAVFGSLDFSAYVLPLSGDAAIRYGAFITAVINFLIIALVLFFIIRGANHLQRQKKEETAPEPEFTKEELLLAEIRDLLKEQNGRVPR